MEGGHKVACYCATFLKPEMWHIYRQIGAIRSFGVTVLTQKRANPDRFPFDPIVEIRRSNWRWLSRIVDRQILRRPMLLTAGEILRLESVLVERGVSLLHIFFGNVGVQLLPLLRRGIWSRPTIVSFHGADVLVEVERPAFRHALEEVCRRATLILARSQSLVAGLLALGCPAEKIRLNRTGIPLAEFPFVPRENPAGKFRLLQACRLIEKKGLTTTLRAFATFAKHFPKSRLTLAGDGPLETSLRTLADELGLGDRVDFPGFLSQGNLRRRLYESHFFLHPSEIGRDGNQEGVPNSLLEAMATGLPVFATRHGGIPEAVENGVSGRLVAEGDHEALGAAMLEAASDPSLLRSMGAAGAQAVAANFNADVQARNLESFYEEAIALGPPT